MASATGITYRNENLQTAITLCSDLHQNYEKYRKEKEFTSILEDRISNLSTLAQKESGSKEIYGLMVSVITIRCPGSKGMSAIWLNFRSKIAEANKVLEGQSKVAQNTEKGYKDTVSRAQNTEILETQNPEIFEKVRVITGCLLMEVARTYSLPDNERDNNLNIIFDGLLPVISAARHALELSAQASLKIATNKLPFNANSTVTVV